MHVRAICILGMLTASCPVLFAGPPVVDDDCALIQVSAGRRPSLSVANGNGDLRLQKHGKRIVAQLDGRMLPPEAVRREGHTLRIVGPRGGTLYMVVLWEHPDPDGQIIYAPDLDPASAHARLGMRTAPLDDDVAQMLGRRPGDGLRVTGICHGLAAAAAGVRDDDVIVAIDGAEGASVEALNRAVGVREPGDSIQLEILRAGRPLTISLAVADAGDWPETGRLEAYIRDQLRPGG